MVRRNANGQVAKLFGSLLVGLAYAQTAWADAPRIDGALSVTSESVGRGFALTDYDVNGVASVTAHWGDFYTNAAVDSFRLAGADTEAYIIAGYAPTVDAFTFDFSVVRYFYPGAPDDLDFWEGAASASVRANDWTASLGARVSDDHFLHSGQALYLYTQVSRPIAQFGDVAVNGRFLLGRQWVEDNAALGAPDWNVVRADLTASRDRWSAGLTYWETDVPDSYNLPAGGKLVATITRGF